MSEEPKTPPTPPPANPPADPPTNPPADPPETPPPAEPKAGQPAHNSMEMATKVAERLDAKMKEIETKEAALDKKMADFDKFVKSTEIEGQTMAGQPPQTAEQKAKDEAMKVIGGSGGLDPFAGEGANALKQ